MSVQAGLEGRDFMLPLPDKSLDGFIRRMADYGMASSMSQALLCELWLEHGGRKETLLCAGLGPLWTEHSERMTLRTWAQAVRVPEDVRRQMGRWRPSADEGYEAAARVNVLRAQKTIAEFIRLNKGRADVFDEYMVMEQVGKRMEGMGLPEQMVEEQLKILCRFTARDSGGPDVHQVRWRMHGPVQFLRPEEGTPATPVDVDEDSEAETIVPGDGGEPKPEGVNLRGQFVISTVGRSGTKTLHKVGECYREPGVHYASYQVIGEEAPNPGEYHQACKVCFPRGGGESTSFPEEGDSDEVSSSDTEGSSGED